MTSWANTPTNPTSTEAMAYDGEGNRVALQVNGSSPTYYLGSLEELNAGTLTTYIPSAPGLPMGVRVGTGGSLSVLATDGRGSVDETLGSSGTATLQQLYAPYGSLRYSTGAPLKTDPQLRRTIGARHRLDLSALARIAPPGGQRPRRVQWQRAPLCRTAAMASVARTPPSRCTTLLNNRIQNSPRVPTSRASRSNAP